MNPVVCVYNKEKEHLKSLITRRTQIVRAIAQQKTEIDQFKDIKDIYESGLKTIKFLQQELKIIEDKISQLQLNNPDFYKQKQIMESVPGIGPVCSSVLSFCLPEIGQISSEKLVSLVGLAPKNYDSGNFKGKRMIGGGRVVVRNALYMCAIASIRHKNNCFYDFYQHLRNNGKPAKVALIAVARKLLLILNSMVKNEQMWDKERCRKSS